MSHIKNKIKPICPYCMKPAALVTGEDIYPHRPDLFPKKFWQCKPCGAYVGCHKLTDSALGRLADAPLRRAKADVHAVFDPLWRSGDRTRKQAYQWLSERLGIKFEDCHVGMFDLETCKKAVEICKLTEEQ